MRLKTFTAPTLAEAMARVRAELGPEAVIVSTEKPPRKPARVVAAIEADDPAPAPLGAAPAPVPAPAAAPFDAALLRHGVPEALRLRLAAVAGPEIETASALADALAVTLAFADPRRVGAAPLVLLGPPGAGKTATAAKLAARLRLDGRNVRLVSCDTWRAAGADQLGVYAAALAIELDVAPDAAALARALRGRDDCVVIVDTPGLDAFAAADRAVAAEIVIAARGDAALVLPAGLDPAESADLAAAFAALGCMRLIATRLDGARRLGGVLAAADSGALALAFAGIGPRIADGLAALDADRLAERLLAPWDAVAPTPRTLERVT